MSEFKYEFTIENENFGEMVECPDLFRLNGKMVLTFSVVALKNEDLTNIDGKASLYAVMNVDFEKKAYEFLHIDSLDEGTDFYAPQTLEDGNGRRIMLAWLDMWNNNSFSKNNRLVSNGVYTLRAIWYWKTAGFYNIPFGKLRISSAIGLRSRRAAK